MNILFTGASSFSGYWFVRDLVDAGHKVTATFCKSDLNKYHDIRRQRLSNLTSGLCDPAFACPFGTQKFMEMLLRADHWDVLCHHAAHVENYKSPNFNIPSAISNNTNNLVSVLESIIRKGCKRVILTGSVFESGEGSGSNGLKAFSPYGLSKSITSQMFRYYCSNTGIHLGKFVLPNPFGPMEDDRFSTYLARCWLSGDVPTVRTPDYIRDNIHISLLSQMYVRFVESDEDKTTFTKANPSGYVGTQRSFAKQLARQLRSRLNLRCPLQFQQQIEFPEPRVRINTDLIDIANLNWNEDKAWNDLANYYVQRFSDSGGDQS